MRESQQEGSRSEMWPFQLSGAAGDCDFWDGSQRRDVQDVCREQCCIPSRALGR